MQFLMYISTFLIPLLIFIIIGYGLLMRKNVYELFIRGAQEGFRTVIQIMPTLIGLMAAVGILRASGFLDMAADIFGKVLSGCGFPAELVPLTIVRMFSSSAATGLALDSTLGLLASLLMSCTETIFYTMSVYFMAAKVKHTRHTLAGALLATFAGIIASVFLAGKIL